MCTQTVKQRPIFQEFTLLEFPKQLQFRKRFLVIKWLSEVKPISDNLITFYCIATAILVFLSETQPIPKYNTASGPQLHQYVYFNPVVLMTYAVAVVLLHIWLYLIRLQTAHVSIQISDNSTHTSKGGIAPFGTEICSFSW